MPLPASFSSFLQQQRDALTLDVTVHETASQAERPSRTPLLLLAQLNPKVGDVLHQAQLHHHCLQQAVTLQRPVLLAFPELSLLGYPVRDAIVKHPQVVWHQLESLAQLAQATATTAVTLLVGFAEPRFEPSLPLQQQVGKPYYNSVALISHGGIQGVVRKCHLPNGAEYDDGRVFEPSTVAGVQALPAWLADRLPRPQQLATLTTEGVFEFHEHRVLVSICEDIWNMPNETLPYGRSFEASPWLPLCPQATLHINLSASVSRAGKPWLKQQYLQAVVAQSGVPLVYLNQVGATDEWVFDGGSCVVQASGVQTVAPWFQSALVAVEASTLAPLSAMPSQPAYHLAPPSPSYNPMDTSDLPRCYHALCLGIRDYFHKNGFQRAVLGLSGGLDSAVNAVLLADALGGDNVLACSFPSRLTPDDNRRDAQTLAQRLGLAWVELPIIETTEAFLTSLQAVAHPALQARWGDPSPWSFARDNVQAMNRATYLRLLGNEFSALPVATSDKSEFYLGYTTVNGDMSGALAPIGDVVKTKVRLLARWLNSHGKTPNAIPEAVITRPSGADLAVDPNTGKLLTAEDALMPYVVSDEIIWRLEVLKQSATAIAEAPWYYEQAIAPLTVDQKEAWVRLFFQRMERSVFKWHIAPPVLICDSHGGITHQQYQHPIASRFYY
ncbi:MAG: NAD(+) synthase [Vampirovibrionales bacterium]